MKEDTAAMKIDRGSTMRMKSKPMARFLRMTSSPPLRAKGMSVSGKTAVAPLTRTAQTERTRFEASPARGVTKEPRMGTRIVRRTVVSTFIGTGCLP